MNRIAFAGKAGSGKTTAATYLVSKGYKYYSLSAKLKEICHELFPEQFEHGAKPRGLLQRVGTDYFRRENPNVWVNYLVRRIKIENPQQAVVDDVRFINEAQALKEVGFVIVKVERPIESNDNHPSETEVDFIHPDLIIWNGATIADLIEQVEALRKYER